MGKLIRSNGYNRSLALVLGLALLFSLFWKNKLTVYGEEGNSGILENSLYAYAAVLMDAGSGRVLYEKNGREKLSNASTTKIMTCILVLEEDILDESAQASAYACAQPKVHLGVKAGEEIQVRELLYALMLESYNDAAVMLAEHIGAKRLKMSDEAQNRSVEDSKRAVAAFAAMMNEKARQIGCTDTSFITPNGLDAVQGEVKHGTTAVDLALIMAYCVEKSAKQKEFLDITQTRQRIFSNNAGNKTYSCVNHNLFLDMMEGAISGKTGFTNSAGYCYVGALKRGDRTYTVALLACGWPNHKTYKWSDSRQLFEYGLDNFEYRVFCPKVNLPQVIVEHGQAADKNPYHTVTITPKMDQMEPIRLLCSEKETVVVELDCKERVSAPITEGDSLGCLNLFFLDQNGEKTLWRQMSLTAGETVKKQNYLFYLGYVTCSFLLGG